MQKTTVYLDPRTKLELEALAKRTGRPQAQLIRDALVGFIEAQRRPALPTFVASAAVGGDAAGDLRARREGESR